MSEEMKKTMVSVGNKVFALREDGKTIRVDKDKEKFVKAMKKDWKD